MDNNNPSQNSLSFNGFNNHYNHLSPDADIQERNINSNDATCNNNNGFSVTNENNNFFLTHTSTSDSNYQQQYDVLNDNNTISTRNYQQPISNGISNDNDTISNYQQYDVSNNVSHLNSQQSMFNNTISPPQYYSHYIDQNLPNSSHFNIYPPFGISINSPQTTIIIMPATISDIQNQLQQINAHLNHSSSQTRFKS
jgi:hypothetical protein